jgi:hypothetical protein
MVFQRRPLITPTIDEAQCQLAELIRAAEQGEEMVITRAEIGDGHGSGDGTC